MIVHYLDPSAWVKRYAEEPGSEWMSRFFSSAPAIGTATLGLIEMLAAFARKQRSGEMTQSGFGRVVGQIEADFEHFIQIDFGRDVLATARQLPTRYALRGSDTVHLASAMHLRDTLAEEGDQVAVVTCDEELALAATFARFPIVNPEMQRKPPRRPR